MPTFESLDEWMKLYREMLAVHPNFLLNLSHVHPNLNNREIKFCALSLFECSVVEIAERMQCNSPEAVASAKYRLRKKLGLKKGEQLTPYLHRLAMYPPPNQESLNRTDF